MGEAVFAFDVGPCRRNCACDSCTFDNGSVVALTTPRVWVATILGTTYTLYRADELYGVILAGASCVWKRHVNETIGCGTANLIWLQITDITQNVNGYDTETNFQLRVDDAFGNALHIYNLRRFPAAGQFGNDCAAVYTLTKGGFYNPDPGSCGGTDTATVDGGDWYLKECCPCGSAAGSGSGAEGHACDNGCCTGTDARESYDVDFGAGGWTDTGCCSGCNEVKGIFTLQQKGAAGNCEWEYHIANFCGSPCPGGPLCQPCDALVINLKRLKDGDGNCYWDLRLTITSSSSSECPACAACPSGAGSNAFYKDTGEAVSAACALGSARTLTRYQHLTTCCGGSLPLTVTIQGV